MKEDKSLSNLGTVALHAAKVPTNVFSSTLICILTLDYSVFFLRVRCSYKHKCGRYHNTFNMREVIMHAQPSSGSMHLIFGPYVHPNGACLSRPLHIVDNFICLC